MIRAKSGPMPPKVGTNQREQPETQALKEEAAEKSRETKPKVKAPKKGVRNAQVNVMVPHDVMDEISRVAKMNSQPASKVLYRLIEEWLKLPKSKRDDVFKRT